MYRISLAAALRAGWNRDCATYYATMRHSGIPALTAYMRVEDRDHAWRPAPPPLVRRRREHTALRTSLENVAGVALGTVVAALLRRKEQP